MGGVNGPLEDSLSLRKRCWLCVSHYCTRWYMLNLNFKKHAIPPCTLYQSDLHTIHAYGIITVYSINMHCGRNHYLSNQEMDLASVNTVKADYFSSVWSASTSTEVIANNFYPTHRSLCQVFISSALWGMQTSQPLPKLKSSLPGPELWLTC